MVTGDIIFVKGNSFWSKLIRWSTSSNITHVALAISPTLIIEANGFKRVTIKSISQTDYINYEIVPILKLINTADILLLANKYVNKKYDYLKIISLFIDLVTGIAFTLHDAKTEFTCVELVKDILGHFDIILSAETPGGLYAEVKAVK